ncbi:MAG: tetratricopeptide repeat protein [Candidatus Obscuribacterales bacterium]|nr:tetratricopeptide repeat protein [Candidatus Obscuribacterales bacterium]
MSAFKNKKKLIALWLKITATCLALTSSAQAAKDADKDLDAWISLVRKGNEYMERGRTNDARKFYSLALKLVEKRSIQDIRKALILHDLADAFRTETKFHEAKMLEVEANSIYKKEIADHQLGNEYSSKKPMDLSAGSLKPACLLCHENWKVVPITYGESTGYDGETPEESDWKFTHKPGGSQIGVQRWYCRECHQAF